MFFSVYGQRVTVGDCGFILSFEEGVSDFYKVGGEICALALRAFSKKSRAEKTVAYSAL